MNSSASSMLRRVRGRRTGPTATGAAAGVAIAGAVTDVLACQNVGRQSGGPLGCDSWDWTVGVAVALPIGGGVLEPDGAAAPTVAVAVGVGVGQNGSTFLLDGSSS